MEEVISDHDWLPKEDAAALLGVQVRQLEKRSSQGFIKKRILPRALTERVAPVRYSRRDIEAFKRGQPNRTESAADPKPNGKPAPPAKTPAVALTVRENTPAAVPAASEPLAVLAAHLARLSAAYAPPPAAKPWLNVTEAAEFSGLPAAWLLAQARSGAIRAVNVGKGSKEFWRFNRDGLRD